MVQIHSPRPLPNSCLSLAYGIFSIWISLKRCGPAVDQLSQNLSRPCGQMQGVQGFRFLDLAVLCQERDT